MEVIEVVEAKAEGCQPVEDAGAKEAVVQEGQPKACQDLAAKDHETTQAAEAAGAAEPAIPAQVGHDGSAKN